MYFGGEPVRASVYHRECVGAVPGILSTVAWRVRRAGWFGGLPEVRSPAVVKRSESPLQGHLRKGADRNRTDA
jgi:hypothetical protein